MSPLLSAIQWSYLTPHPDSGAHPVDSLSAEAHLAAPAVLACDYVLHGDLARLRVPAGAGGARRDELWKHTCLEAFVTAPGARGYYEFNFAPDGDWAAYAFEDYRHGMHPVHLVAPPLIHAECGAARLAVYVSLELAGLPDLAEARTLKLALAAVIEGADGTLSYWALHHAPGRADFHHPEGFTLELECP